MRFSDNVLLALLALEPIRTFAAPTAETFTDHNSRDETSISSIHPVSPNYVAYLLTKSASPTARGAICKGESQTHRFRHSVPYPHPTRWSWYWDRTWD